MIIDPYSVIFSERKHETYHINSIDGTQFERLLLGIQDDIDHCTELSW